MRFSRSHVRQGILTANTFTAEKTESAILTGRFAKKNKKKLNTMGAKYHKGRTIKKQSADQTALKCFAKKNIEKFAFEAPSGQT